MFNIMITISFIFMWLNHPLVMAISIILQTMLIAIYMGTTLGSFWFSYIILIIMTSGMLVLFMYMASIASNEMFKASMKLMVYSITILAISFNINFEEMTLNLPKNYLNIMLNWLFNSSTMMITIMMVMYLFFVMIVVSKIVNINEGPLRIKK
uniref:NADH dehydrogenase subunit 6 n=1 Tax=Capodemus sinuatus TaxID=2969366 RepID=UPI002176CEE0|nr:NADH dehydrogenase subunit 6 [Capodemus sinuatus]UUJ37735.1 NADH dehydrogenase subunit 6 [Capodemus sinuatus]